jgi:hypothetical protein
MAFDVNEFISIKPIVDQLNQNPNSKIKISKSQSRVLANMPEDKFNSFLDLMRRPFSQPNPPTNSPIFIQNIEAIQSTRDQRLAARVNNPGFVKAARMKQEKEETRRFTSNFVRSQKEAVDFLKQEEKPFNFLNKPYFKRGDLGLRQSIENDQLFRKELSLNRKRISRSKRGLPPMVEGMEQLGLPMRAQDKLRGPIQKALDLEVFKSYPGLVTQSDELTSASIAEGRSVRLGDITKPFPHAPMSLENPLYKIDEDILSKSERQNRYMWRNLLEKEKQYQSKIEARRFGKSVEEMLEEEKLFIKNYEEFDRFRSGDTRFMDSTRRMPPMLDRPTINQPLTNIGAEKRLDSFRRAQQARVSTQGGQNTPIQQASSVTPPPRTSSRVAQMLGEDTVRAASVIHSSKMNYATVGLAGMAAVFGIASASRQRANMEQEIQSRF